MTISRVYQPVDLATGAEIPLDAQASHHIAKVLRARIGDHLTLFNGTGGEFDAEISTISKKAVQVTIGAFDNRSAESPLKLCLAQGISRGEKMGYIIQKAVELGVSQIVPLLTERCTVKLDDERRQKRFQHWQSIVVSACEQSGRNILPELLVPLSLDDWLADLEADLCLVLAPTSVEKIGSLKINANARIVLLIGPEGGLSAPEINQSVKKGFKSINIGPRILRTETAATAALTILECIFGDMVI
jgi:16S rRNA (uracil1498-N3)-methyltransferase